MRQRGREQSVAQGGEGEDRQQEQGVGGAPAVERALVEQGLEADGGEAYGERAPGEVVEHGPPARDVRHAAQERGDEDDGQDLEGPVVRGFSAVLSQQGVRQGRGGAERRGLPALRAGPPGEFADGDQGAEGEGETAFGEPVPQGVEEADGGQQGGGGVDEGEQERRSADGARGDHRCAPGALVTGGRAGGVPASAVTVGCQP